MMQCPGIRMTRFGIHACIGETVYPTCLGQLRSPHFMRTLPSHISCNPLQHVHTLCMCRTNTGTRYLWVVTDKQPKHANSIQAVTTCQSYIPTSLHLMKPSGDAFHLHHSYDTIRKVPCDKSHPNHKQI